MSCLLKTQFAKKVCRRRPWLSNVKMLGWEIISPSLIETFDISKVPFAGAKSDQSEFQTGTSSSWCLVKAF